jgi:hypothetical protein
MNELSLLWVQPLRQKALPSDGPQPSIKRRSLNTSQSADGSGERYPLEGHAPGNSCASCPATLPQEAHPSVPVHERSPGSS